MIPGDLARLKLGLHPHITPEGLAAVLRGYQQLMGLPVTGRLDAATEAHLGPPATTGLIPEWWPHDVKRVVAERVGDEQAVRRFQSAHHITPTGVVDEETARAIGD